MPAVTTPWTGSPRPAQGSGEAEREPKLRGVSEPVQHSADRGERQREGRMREGHLAVPWRTGEKGTGFRASCVSQRGT